MVPRPLGRTDLLVSPIGFGAFKIGRNEKIKYAAGYALPGEDEVRDLLAGLGGLGIRYFDTAPAYGLSEARLGACLADAEAVVSTKVGETFEDGVSRYDFSAEAVRTSVARSAARLGRRPLDLVFVHAHGDDAAILAETPVVATLEALRAEGLIRYLGFSGKTVAAAERALDWADALMVEYHLRDRSHEEVLQAARSRGVGVVIKKALASGVLDSEAALRFVLEHPAVDSVVVGSLNREHMAANVAIAEAVRGR